MTEQKDGGDSEDFVQTNVNTGGGSYISGTVKIKRGHFIGRDLVIYLFDILLVKKAAQSVYYFLKTYYQLLIVFLVLETPLLIIFFYYRERYLLSWTIFTIISLLLLITILCWRWTIQSYFNKLIQWQRFTLSSLITLIFVTFIIQQVQVVLYPQKISSDKFGIAVAAFGEGSDFRFTQRARQLSGLLMNDLVKAIHDSPELDGKVELKPIGVVTSTTVGIQEGKRVGAELVLWGQLLEGSDGAVIHLQVLETLGLKYESAFPRVLPIDIPGPHSSVNVTDPNSLIITEVASRQNLGLAAFSLGVYFYLEEQKPGLAAKRFEDAVSFLQNSHVSDKESNLSLVYYYLGKSYQLQGKYELSQAMLDQAEILHPTDPAIVLGKAYNYYALGQYANLQRAVDKVIELSGQYPDNIAAYYDRALAYELINDHKSVLREYNALIKLAPDLFVAYLGAGQALINLVQFDKARVAYTHAQDLVHNDPLKGAWLNLYWGQLDERTDEIGNAINAYSSAIKLRPTLATSYLYRAKLYEKIKNFDAAYFDYRKLLEVSENRPEAYSLLGRFFAKLDNYQQAIEQYHEALSYRPDDNSLIHAYLADAYIAIHKEDMALDEFKLALQKPGPYEAFIRSLYGIALVKLNHITDAIDQLEQSIRLSSPNLDIPTSLNLGQLYESRGSIKKAKALYISLLERRNEISTDNLNIIEERLKKLQS